MKKSVLILALACCSMSVSARADTDSKSKLLAKLETIEHRVLDLEKQNRELKQEIQALTDTRQRVQNAQSKSSPSSAYASMSYKSPPMPAVAAPVGRDIWTGFYWGASAGGGVTRSQISTAEAYQASSFGETISMFGNASGSGAGALIDLYGGWNWRVKQDLLLGVQAEATLSNLSFGGAGQTTYLYGPPPIVGSAVGTFNPLVNSDWIVSILGRAGLLLDDKTLVYAIGGWTLADFQTRNLEDNSFYQTPQSFHASGWTAGAGLERKIDARWSARAEYRYTDFGTASLPGFYNFTAEVSGTSSSQSFARQAQFHQTMQVGRIGVAYGFLPD